MAELSMVEALNLALARAMAEDETVLVLGEDIGRAGGVFRVTDGVPASRNCNAYTNSHRNGCPTTNSVYISITH